MKQRFIILFLMLVIPLIGIAQSVSSRYSGRMTQDGMCYFFRKMKLSEKEGVKDFYYDMTYLDWTDSITVNFSIIADKPETPKMLTIISGDTTFVCDNLKCLFVDVLKKGYEIRMSSSFSEKAIRKMIETSSAPIFQVKFKDNVTAAYSKSSWKKDSKMLQMIFQMIDVVK